MFFLEKKKKTFRFLQAKKSQEDKFITNHQIRVLYRKKDGYGLSVLEKMGAECVQADYENQDQLKKCVQNARTVAVIPEHSENRLKEAQNLLEACRDQKIEFLCLHSMIGADTGKNHNELKTLKELYEIEEMVKKYFQENHGIIRHTMFSQAFYYMAPQIEGKGEVALPVKEDVKWGTVDLNDSINAVYILARMEHESREKNGGKRMEKLVQFTPTQMRTTKEMVQEIGRGLGRENLYFKHASEEEIKKYLQEARKGEKFKERPKDSEDNKHLDRDGPWSFPLGMFLNDKAIECMMEFWKMANMGKADIQTDDLKKIMKREPKNLEEYFKKNRDQFKQFK
ncbi:hypothetical protein BY458DRAFT_498542 [Sporodiniella umbellata]|nr:hypothetical protein BY458DRAFT_498542 [Sporodiniella umbellata]